MKRIMMDKAPENYITTLQAQSRLKEGKTLDGIQKYKMLGSRKTYYLLDDLTDILADTTSKKTATPEKESESKKQDRPQDPPVLVTKAQEENISEMPELTLFAYVDGSYNKGLKIYGSGAIIVHDGEVLAATKETGKKMNSMWNIAGEIAAAAIAVKLAEQFMPDHLVIRYDCEAVEKWPTGKWSIKNDYARKYVDFMHRKRPFDIRYEHVKAHSGDRFNDLADKMASQAAGF